ncbi:LOW QUALITY PROTEIN: proline-rich transmembrane protein 4 [Colossoma macropomum]|uniref:LOW QUALITY PROTEIN: proline-rich transmembrane protein 4 n=1 Tax=Colossoma macropomum TaxID=42526 RepID=UPI001864AEE2|nr:LOW QUALITY PROTEIN: proline-rich transmembrane protein 4 [Colossoma macropomum]
MLLLRRTLVVCFLLLFFSSASGGLFGRSGPKPTTQSKGASGTWGVPDFGKWIPDMPIPSLKLPFPFLTQNVKAQVATTMQNPTTESPPKSSEIITTQDDTVSVDAQVDTTIQNPTTESSNSITTQDHTVSVEAQVATTIQNPTTESSNIITTQDHTVSVEAPVATTLRNPISERPPASSNITSQGYAVFVEAPTSPTYQIITLRPEETPTSPAQIGTLLPQRGTKPPKNNLLRGRQQTDKPKTLSEPDPNFDLEFWPSNRGRHSEKTPQTAPPPVSTQKTNGYVIGTSQETTTSSTQVNQRTKQTTKSVEFQNAKTKSLKNDQITTTGFQSLTSLEPRLMTSQPKVIKSTTTQQQPAVSTSLPTEPTTKLQLSLTTTPESSLSTTQIVEETPVPQQTPEVEATNGPPDRLPWLVMSASKPQEGHLGSIPNVTHTALTTASSAGGLEKEKTEANTEKPTELTSMTTLKTTLKTTEMPTTVSEDWLPDMTQESALPDCNAEHSGVCNYSIPWAPTYPPDNSNNDSIPTGSSNQSQTPMLFPSLPMFVPLYSDWNSAMAAWGLAWEAHIYGLGTVFCLISLASALNLLCLPLCCPSGCGYFALVSLFLLAAGCTRAFALLYDAYGHQDRMASTEASLLLYEAPFPCMTAAFGLVFLLLSMRSRMQLSYSTFQRPCFLACLVLLHFTAAFGPVTLLRVDQRGAPLCLFLSLISRGAFVALATFLSVAYFVFYCYVRADSKHIYHLNNTSPTPAERYNRCPFAESQDWDRAAVAMFLSAIFSLACAGLQLYAMLHALGVAGGADVFQPWPWWAFQLSCRVCEAVVCLTLALVVSQPVYCSEHLPQPGSCWMELLAAKSPIIPGSYQWTLTQQEKLAICDPIGHGEIECLPLYTLVDDRMGSLNGLDLLYHSNRALAYRDLDLDLPETVPNTGAPSVGSSYTSDSTADLRPPSPINLRRSIDEALFSEALFPMSLFSPMRPFTSSDHSLEGRDTGSTSGPTLRDTHPSDPGLYRTSSCMEMQAQAPLPVQAQQDAPSLAFPPSPSPSLTSSCCSSAERWRGSSSSCSLYRPSLAGSSLKLCSSPEGHNPALCTISDGSGCPATTGPQGASQQRHCRTQNSQERLEQQPELDQSVQEEFISVCRQIDALSVCSETIDL